MLHIITPAERHNYGDMISQMFTHLHSVPPEIGGYEEDKFDANDAVYCVYIDDRLGIIGSARLLPRPAFLENHVQVEEGGEEFWECNRVFFDIHEDAPIHEDPTAFRVVAEQFYQELHKGIKAFGKNYGFKSLVCVNPVDEHEDMVFFGQWAFEVESLVDLEQDGKVSTFAVGGCRLD